MEVLAGLEAEQHVLRLGVLAVDVVDVVRRDDGHAQLFGPSREDAVALALLRDRVVLDFDVVIVAEDVQVLFEYTEAFFFSFLQDGL